MLIQSFGLLPLLHADQGNNLFVSRDTSIYQALIKHPPTDKLLAWEETDSDTETETETETQAEAEAVVKVLDEGRHRVAATSTSECVQQKVATKSEKRKERKVGSKIKLSASVGKFPEA